MPASSPLPADAIEPVELRLPRRYLVAMLAVGAVLLLFMALVGYSLVNQLRTIQDTDRKIQGLNRSLQPLARNARDQAQNQRDALKRTRKLLRTAQPLAEDLGPVVDDLGPLLDDLGPLAASLSAKDLAGLVSGGSGLLSELQRRALLQRSSRTLGALQAFLVRADDANLVQDADRAAERAVIDFPALVRLQRRTLETQLQTKALNRQTLASTRELLGLTRQTAADAKRAADAAQSIDRKFGGQLPTK